MSEGPKGGTLVNSLKTIDLKIYDTNYFIEILKSILLHRWLEDLSLIYII